MSTDTTAAAGSAAPTTKFCGGCALTLDVNQFGLRSIATGRRQARCRKCVSDYNRAHHARNRETVNPVIHRTSRAHREFLISLADGLRHTLACHTCGRVRARGADIMLVPPRELTGQRNLGEVIRNGWSEPRFRALLEATVAHPDGVRCSRCFKRETGLARIQSARAASVDA